MCGYQIYPGDNLEKSYIVVLVTVGSKLEGEKITQNLLSQKIIACANVVGPITSHFHWAGKIDRAEEYLVIMKSRIDLFDELSERVVAMHSYEVPEILALPILSASRSYIDWLEQSIR